MGGRLLDWLGAGLTADRPAAEDMVDRLVPDSTAVYFHTDDKIFSIFDPEGDGVTPAWFEVDVSAVAALSFETLPDVDWTTPPNDGDLFAWDATAEKLHPVPAPVIPVLPTTEELQDLIGGMFLDGPGMTVLYDDGVGKILVTCNINQYTDELARDAIAAAATQGTGILITNDDGGDTLTFAIDPVWLAAQMPTLPAESSLAQIFAGTDAATRVSPRRIMEAAASVPVAYAGIITLDGDTGFNFHTTLTGAVAFANPSNMEEGQSGIIEITQDATGTRVATWGSNWRFPGGAAAAGVLSTAANAVDLVSYYVRGGLIHASLVKGMAA
jgi:hypothetical protein